MQVVSDTAITICLSEIGFPLDFAEAQFWENNPDHSWPELPVNNQWYDISDLSCPWERLPTQMNYRLYYYLGGEDRFGSMQDPRFVERKEYLLTQYNIL